MRLEIFFASILVLLCFTAIAVADDPLKTKTELVLYKEPLFGVRAGILGRREGSDCDGLFYVDGGKNLVDFRDFRFDLCEGIYTLTLDGPPGTMVTLFGQRGFGTGHGYLVVRKKDKRKVWILNLQNFPDQQWFSKEPNDNTGAYEVFYHPEHNFAQKVSSVQWGEWRDKRE